ncbi:hypothetical protein BC833DRAFT_661963 [Globomyces pollinis-pini]|nr:hypothetical protein BC833DRAFT_661963 [Globomyces pollinis-pini]
MLFILSALLPLLSAQQNCADTNYEACKEQAKVFLDKTCTPLASSSMPNYQSCLCYQVVNESYCYAQCKDNATVQAEYQKVNQPKLTTLCKAANLDPFNLPKTAPWVIVPTSTLGLQPTLPAISTGLPGAKPSPTNGSSKDGIMIGLVVVLMSMI